MEKNILQVEGMSCEHCVKAITNAVGALSGVSEVAVDLSKHTVTVEYDAKQVSLDRIRGEIEEQGYEIAK